MKMSFIFLINKIYLGDWGLGIGDWVPNPQSPIPRKYG